MSCSFISMIILVLASAAFHFAPPSELQRVQAIIDQKRHVKIAFLDMSNQKISSLQDLEFPGSLDTLVLSHNQISSIKGTRFPARLTSLDLSHNHIACMKGIVLPSGLTSLNLKGNAMSDLDGFVFPARLTSLRMDKRLKPLVPNVLQRRVKDGKLTIVYNGLSDLEGKQFPESASTSFQKDALNSESFAFPYASPQDPETKGGFNFIHNNFYLKESTRVQAIIDQKRHVKIAFLDMSNQKISSLQDLEFPGSLDTLVLSHNQISSIKGTRFPARLTSLDLSHNHIACMKGIVLPSGLTSLNLEGNAMSDLDGFVFPARLTSLRMDKRLKPLVPNVLQRRVKDGKLTIVYNENTKPKESKKFEGPLDYLYKFS